MIPDGWAWNQAELDKNHSLNEGLVSLLAFDRAGSPRVVGSGFFVSAQLDAAVVCTAAHVLREAERLQQPPTISHPTTLPEFRNQRRELDISPDSLRVVCVFGSRVEVANVVWCVLDDTADFAFIGVEPQPAEPKFTFARELRFTSRRVNVGDKMAVIGYNAMSTAPMEPLGQEPRSFQLSRELVLRLGTVTVIHDQGHILCRSACFETSVPVSSGMSGSPIVLYTEDGAPIEVVGVICSAPEPDNPDILDRRVSGCSIAARLSPELSTLNDAKITAKVRLKSAEVVRKDAAPTVITEGT
jgi:hypothetical protein